jgi:Flp pilus assembly pilin Flp
MIYLLIRAFGALHSDEDGQAMVEYALILALVVVGSVGILGTIGGTLSTIFSQVNADF